MPSELYVDQFHNSVNLRLVEVINELPSEVCFDHILLTSVPSCRDNCLLLQVAGVGLDAAELDSELSSVRRRNQVSGIAFDILTLILQMLGAIESTGGLRPCGRHHAIFVAHCS